MLTDKPPSKLLAYYRPLVIACSETGEPTWFSRLKTFFICWPDHTDPSRSIILWSIGSCLFFLADTAWDLSVAVQYYDDSDHYWASWLIAFIFLPTVISLIYYVLWKRVLWYEAYPVGMIYWLV